MEAEFYVLKDDPRKGFRPTARLEHPVGSTTEDTMLSHEIARKHGGFASLMPKPYADRAGSGAHFSTSLADKGSDKNLFADAKDPRGYGLSKLGYRFLAGVLTCRPSAR